MTATEWAFIPGAHKDIEGMLGEVVTVGRTFSLVECPLCRAAVPNTEDARDGHIRWHNEIASR